MNAWYVWALVAAAGPTLVGPVLRWSGWISRREYYASSAVCDFILTAVGVHAHSPLLIGSAGFWTAYDLWRWRNTDDDDGPPRRRRKAGRAVLAKLRSFTPSPIGIGLGPHASPP